MNPNDILNVLRAAKNGPFGNVNEDLFPGVVEYCVGAGLVRAIPIAHSTSPHPEYILQGITSKGEDYLNESRLSRRLSAVFDKRWVPILGGVAVVFTIASATIHWWRRR